MTVKALKTFNIKEFEMAQLQKNVKEFSDQLSNPFLVGLLIEDIEISNTAPTNINHGLGKAVSGWLIVKINQNSTIWADEANQTLTSVLALSSSFVGTTKINIWIF